MPLAELGLTASTIQSCVARHAHTHTHASRQQRTHSDVLSSDVGYRPDAVFIRTSTSVISVAADVDIQYQRMYTLTSTVRQGIDIALGEQHRASLQPTKVGPHSHIHTLPGQGWIGNSSRRLGGHSPAIHRPTFHSIATPYTNASFKQPSSTASAGGTPKNYSSFSGLGSHGRRRASRFSVLIIVAILTGIALFRWG